MKWKLVGCVILLVCLIMPAAPVMAGGGTASVTVPLVAHEVSASSITTSRATISWKTNGDATSQVFYDTVSHDNVTGYPYHTTEAPSPVSEHGVTLTGLSSATTYHYRVRSRITGTDFVATSNDTSFTTLVAAAGGVVGAPPVTTVTPSGLVSTVPLQVNWQGVVQSTCQLKSPDAKLILDIAKDTKLLDSQGNALRVLWAVPVPSPPAPPSGATIIVAYALGPDGATFSPPITFSYNYKPGDIPTGVDEKDMVLAYYDTAAGKWVELPSTVDPITHIITASVSHFTQFAVIAYAPPAAFTVSDFSISPTQVNIGEKVTISAIVTNTGGLSDSYDVILKIDNVAVETKTITLASGVSQAVTFTTSKDIAGTYTVDVNGLPGTFMVKAVEVPPKPAAFTVSALSISPTEVNTGESVTISTVVANTGGLSGSYEITLKINNVAVETKTVILAGGASQTVTFTTAKDIAGTYTINVNGQLGIFTVKAVEVPPLPTGIAWWVWVIIGVAVVVVVALLVYFLVVRRRAT